MKTKILFYFLLLSFAFIFFTCDSTEPGKDTLSLTVEDVSSTEVWLKLTGKTDGEFIVERNNEEVKIITLTGTDNIIYEDSLQPSTTYTYQVNGSHAISNEITATTMDTTSHNFTWQTFTFGGQGGSSALYDVAIIDENDIWAVGEIYTADDKYNAVHWNGSKWELKKIYYYGDCSAVMYPPLRAIYAFSENEIVITNGGSIGWFNGTEVNLDCEINPLLTGAINRIWGISSTDFYVVGNNGTIAHYDGTSWKKIESGTDLDLYDIWGDKNKQTGEHEILAVGGKLLQSFDRVIISIEPNGSQILDDSGINWSLHGVWFKSDGLYLVVGSGIFTKKSLEESKWKSNINDIINYYIKGINGSGYNDIWLAGSFGEIAHYNGLSWKNYLEKEVQMINGSLLRISIKDKKVCTVGYSDREAIIYIGTR